MRVKSYARGRWSLIWTCRPCVIIKAVHLYFCFVYIARQPRTTWPAYVKTFYMTMPFPSVSLDKIAKSVYNFTILSYRSPVRVCLLGLRKSGTHCAIRCLRSIKQRRPWPSCPTSVAYIFYQWQGWCLSSAIVREGWLGFGGQRGGFSLALQQRQVPAAANEWWSPHQHNLLCSWRNR